jgi:competence ComEA-like helix-hairpin-helix protein
LSHIRRSPSHYDYGGLFLFILFLILVAFAKDINLPSGKGKEVALIGPAAGFAMKGRVDINTASGSELAALPGIGRAMAERIVEKRKSIGGFSAVEELKEVKGMGQSKVAKIMPHIRVDAAVKGN